MPTDPTVAKLDDLQSELGDGPCFTPLREHYTVHIADRTTDTRWPQFARQATELGVFSLLSFQRDNLTGLQAFNLLVRASRETNIKLVEVARWLVEDHEGRL